MNTETRQPNIWKFASTAGLIMGLAIAVVQFAYYLLEGKINYPFVILILQLAITIAVIIIATQKYRNQLDGYISYWHAFTLGILIFLFAGMFGAIYSYILNSVDPEYAYRQIEITGQQLYGNLIGFELGRLSSTSQELADSIRNAVQLQVDETVYLLKKNLDEQVLHPFRTIFLSGAIHMILGSIFCLISSALLKKNKPVIYN